MVKWFNDQPRLIQIILLIIPFVNWIIELCVRWSKFLESKNPGHLIVAILVTFGGLIFGWLDAIWCLLFHHLLFAA